MLRIALTFFALAASCGAMATGAPQSAEGPRAIAVLLTTDPWLMVIGSDTPQFALYDDGKVIYVDRTSGRQSTRMTAILTSSELADAKSTLLTFVKDPVPETIDLRPGWTDQPESRFFLEIDGHRLVTSVGGLGDSADVDKRDSGDGDALPASIRDLHRYMSGFHAVAATKWIPDQIEVMFWDYSYAPEASIQWPLAWPGLGDPTTQRRGDAYSIFLAGSQEEALIAFLATRNQKGAVELGGRKWAVSYRPVFPAWREAFDD